MQLTILILAVVILVVLIFTCLFTMATLAKLIEFEKGMINILALVNRFSNDQSLLIQNMIKLSRVIDSLSEFVFDSTDNPNNNFSPEDEEIIGLLQQDNMELTQNDINEFKRIFKEEKDLNKDNDINGVS